jgi:hypothetical protein
MKTVDFEHQIFKIDRIAQSVERWSNKPLVMGSSPIVIKFLYILIRTYVVSVDTYTCTLPIQ